MNPLNAGQVYTVKITSVTNTSHYPDGTPAPYTMSVSLDLLSGSTPILATQKQTYAFGPGETRSIDKGNPFAFDITAPSGYPSATFIAKLLDTNNNVLAQASLAISIVSANGTLNLSSSPSGALVYVNGVSQGIVTPASLNLAPDTYSLSLVLAGYNTVNVQVTLSYQEQKSLNYTLTPLTTGVAFSSTPSGASLYLGSTLMGVTPITLSLGIGTYTFTMKLSGYQDLTESFTLTGAYSSIQIGRSLTLIPPPTPSLSFDSIWAEGLWVYGKYALIHVTIANHTDQPITGRLVRFHTKYMSPYTQTWVEVTSDFLSALTVYGEYVTFWIGATEDYSGVPVLCSPPGLISLAPGQSKVIYYIPNVQLDSQLPNYMYLEDAATGIQSAQVTL